MKGRAIIKDLDQDQTQNIIVWSWISWIYSALTVGLVKACKFELFGVPMVFSSRKKIELRPYNHPCFQCNIAITNFLVSNTCEIRFHDVIGQSTVHMYSYAKILKHGWSTWPNEYVLGLFFFNLIRWIQLYGKTNLTFVDCSDKISLNSFWKKCSLARQRLT